MKLFRNLLDNIKPHFEKGGKFEKFHPAYDAFETFLFVPGHTNHNGVHVRDSIDMKRTMITVVIALVPALLFGIWNTGHQHFLAIGQTADLLDKFLFGLGLVLPIIIVSYAVGLGVEFAFAIIKGHKVNEGFLVTGILIPLVLPASIPLWMVALATIFSVIFGKEVFGGTGMNIMNPALVARAFLFFAFPAQMSGEIWNVFNPAEVVDGYSGATALAAFDSDWQNLPPVSDLFLGTIQGSIGETSKLAILIGALILLISGIGSWRVMISVFAGGLAMGYLFNLMAINQAMQMPAYYHLLIGGFAFGAVFMATDPVSAAQTNKGKYIYGFLIGAFCVLLRVVNPAYPEGMMLSILLFNVFAPLIDHFVVQSNISRRLKRAVALSKNGMASKSEKVVASH